MTRTRFGFCARGLLAALLCGWVLGPGPQAAPGQVVPPPEKPGAPVDLAAEPEAEAVVEPVSEQQAVAPAEGAGDVVIGAAPVAGTFYPAAGALCREVNAGLEEHGLRCLVQESEGSSDNLGRLREGTLDLAIVQSDWAFHAAAGSTVERLPPFTQLRGLMILQPQLMTLVASIDSGIEGAGDLEGKRLAIGPAGSGVNDAARALLGALSLSERVTLLELPLEEQPLALCNREIDAFLLPVAHPNGAIADALELCGGQLVDLQDPAIDAMVATWPYLVQATIPTGAYGLASDPVAGYGLVAMLVTTEALPEETAYQVVKSIYERLDDLRAQHPALSLLTEETMSGAGLSSLPLHPGALRYYQERGWR